MTGNTGKTNKKSRYVAVFEVEFEPNLMCDEESLKKDYGGSWLKCLKAIYEAEDLSIFDEPLKLVNVVVTTPEYLTCQCGYSTTQKPDFEQHLKDSGHGMMVQTDDQTLPNLRTQIEEIIFSGNQEPYKSFLKQIQTDKVDQLISLFEAYAQDKKEKQTGKGGEK